MWKIFMSRNRWHSRPSYTYRKTLYFLQAPTQTSEACSKRQHNSETDCVLWSASGAGIMSDEVSRSCDRQRRTADWVWLYARIFARTEAEGMSCECQNKPKLMD